MASHARILASRIVGTPLPGATGSAAARNVYMLHGLLGSSRNWTGFATALAGNEVPDTRFTLLDLRNHGASKGFPAPHTLDACVDDVLATAAAADAPPTALVGHSLGGKVLLQLASRREEVAALAARTPTGRLPLIVLDSLPGARSAVSATAAASDSVARVLRVVEAARSHVPSRAWVMERCAAEGIERGVAAWLASCVSRLDGNGPGEAGRRSEGLAWGFAPDTAAALCASCLATNRWEVLLTGAPPGVGLHMVVASRSSRWRAAGTAADMAAAKAAAAARRPGTAGAVTFTTIDAGHWVHVDNPSALRTILGGLLR